MSILLFEPEQNLWQQATAKCQCLPKHWIKKYFHLFALRWDHLIWKYGQMSKTCAHNTDDLVHYVVLAHTCFCWQIFKPCLIFWSSSIHEELSASFICFNPWTDQKSFTLPKQQVHLLTYFKVNEEKISACMFYIWLVSYILCLAIVLLLSQLLWHCLFRLK